MKVFSDIPEFIIDEYINGILETYDSTPITTINTWNKVLFTNTTNVTFTNTDFIDFNSSYTIGDKASQTNSYLITPKHFILTKGGNRIEAYIEEDTNYQEIGLLPVSNYKTNSENGYGSYYEFNISNETYPTSSSDILYTLTESSTGAQSYLKYNFIQYDCFNTPLYKTIDSKIGQKVLLRKNGVFQEWGNELYSDHINFNKDYIYLGDIYPYENEYNCRIYRYLLKDLIVKFLPPNNRTDKLTEFLSISFDQVYNKIYKQQKNLKTLYDGLESESKYLNDLTTGLYDINIDDYGLSKESRLRDLVRNMPIILKKKGTYSSLIGVWKFITGFDSTIDSRDINIYEWWHNTLPKYQYTVPTSGFVEINYINQYDTSTSFIGGCGDSYYSQYNTSYPSFYSSNLNPIITNSFIHKQDVANSTWNATHWINEDKMIIQCYNHNFQEIIPKSIKIPDSSECIITFSEPTSGYCVFAKVNYGELKKGSYWDISHYINKKSVLTQSFSTFNERFLPKNVYKKDYDNDIITIDTNTQDGYGYFIEGDYIYHSRTNQSVWTVTHNVNALLLVQCYDINDNLIMPSNIDQSDFKTLTITFNQSINGYVILKRIGNPTPIGSELSVLNIDNISNTTGSILSPHYKIEMDLTCKPIDPNGIFTELTSKNLYDNLENIRSVDRVSHYHTVISPLTDYSENIIGTYDKQYDPYLYSKYISSINIDDISTYTQITSASTWNITHNIKSKDVIIYVYDNDYNRIFPESIEIIDIFNINIHFSEDTLQTGYAIIIKSDKLDYIYETLDSNIIHSWDRKIISQFSTLTSDNIIFPESIINNENSLYISASENGYANLVEGNLLWTQNTELSEWSIEHNFDSIGVIAEFFDGNWNKIYPETFTLSDNNTCSLTFSEPISGYGVLKDIGFINNKNDIINTLTSKGATVKLGSGTSKTYINNSNITDVQTELTTININKNDIYTYGTDLIIDIKLPLNIEYDIREIGIFNAENTLMYFYSQCSELFKNNKYTMTIHYKIKYEDI